MSRSGIAWLLAGVVVAALLAAAFLAAFERVAEEREVGYAGEARRNPLLAFERLAGDLGIVVERPGDPLALPPADHVILALGAHHPPGPLYLEELLTWVGDGGHLVFVPAGGGERSVEPLLDRLGIAVVWPAPASGPAEGPEPAGDSQATDATGEARPAGAADDGVAGGVAGGAPSPPIALAVSPAASPRRVAMPRWPVLLATAEGVHLSGRGDQPSLIAQSRGAGRITVLADAGFLANDEIGRLDHALFAWDLLAARGRPAGLAIVDWRRAIPLSALAARRGWPLATAGALLVVAWIAFRGARFGPPLADAAPTRRSLLEHLRANGDFLWRHGQSRVLLAASRSALAHRLELAHAEWSRQPEAERVRRLARFADLPAGAVAAALEGDATDAAEFTRTVATLERLRRSS
ncbi:MAG TPA: DUF4350 domain-containing protein [Thermoanaerobaculia bacterium]|nr:DUF4350 domain-containing protein [Thermoanaerobaculia bacterium]